MIAYSIETITTITTTTLAKTHMASIGGHCPLTN